MGKHGQGIHEYANGDIYRGEWVDGRRHGIGTKYEASTRHEFKQEYWEGELLSSKQVVLLKNGTSSKRPHIDEADGPVVLDGKDAMCAMYAANENAESRLPALCSSKGCHHDFCHECVLKEQIRIAKDENNGSLPDWIRCMICRDNGLERHGGSLHKSELQLSQPPAA